MTDETPALVIDWLNGHCPVQAEGTVDGKAFYFRSRGDRWSMSIGGADVVGNPDWRHEEPYGTWPEAGYISDDEARAFIDHAVALYRADAAKSPESRNQRPIS